MYIVTVIARPERATVPAGSGCLDRRPRNVAAVQNAGACHPPVCPSLSARFEDAREGVYGKHTGAGLPPCLHECRSLAERLYRKQGIDTRTLLGHKRQSMTDTYNDDRGLSDGEWKTLEV